MNGWLDTFDFRRALLIAIVSMTLAVSGKAATISWTVFNVTSNVTDVSTNGTAVEAHGGADLGTADVVDGSTFDINGVTFDDDYVFDSPSHNDNIGTRAAVPGSGPNAAYYTLLRFTDRQGSGNATFTFTNLVLNATYEIQVWHSDTAAVFQDAGLVLNTGGIANTPTHGTAGHATLLREVADGEAGQYAIGSFTANAKTQQFLARAVGGLTTTPAAQNNTTINAVQLRLIRLPAKLMFIIR